MSNVDYVVRDVTGGVQRGSFPEGDPTTIYVSYSKDVSLNLKPADVASYQRHGNDLLVSLGDGQVLVLSGYFDEGTTGDKNLFLSEEGEFVEVVLDEGVGGEFHASYSAIDVGGKWSAYDELVFLDLGQIEQVVAPLVAPLAGSLAGLLGGGAALAAGAAVVGGGGGDDGGGVGGGGGTTVIQPTVDNPDDTHLIGGTGPDNTSVSGTGAAGSQVVVTIGGQSQTVTVDTDGTWVATFDPADLPGDGVYQVTVSVDDLDGNHFDLSGPTIDIDTTAPVLTVDSGTQSTGDLVNDAGHSSGATITGTGEAGATVEVTIDGTTHSTTVDATGAWSVTFSSTEIQTGEYTSAVTIVTTDTRGNFSSTSEVLVVDTVAPAADLSAVEGDDVINASEAADGSTLTGTGEAGATITVEFQGITRSTTVNASGAWSMDFAASEIAAGTYDSTITLTSTDAAGNSSSSTHTVRVDTATSLGLDSGQAGGDDLLNAAEAAAGLALTGTAEAGATVEVTFQGVTRNVTADASGQWSASYTAAEIAPGQYDAPVQVSSTDTAGNTETTSGTVRVDTETSVSIAPGYAGGDQTVSAAEAQAGVTFTGAAEPGSTVLVTVAGVSRTAAVDASGNWTAIYGGGALPAGEYDTTISVNSTDAAGNTASATSSIRIDTVAGTVALSSQPIEIDDIINATERADGVIINGTATPGLTVTATLGSATQQAVADANGNWSVTIPAASIPTGAMTLPITASITDAAGNGSSVSDTVRLDTFVDNHAFNNAGTVEGDGVVNAQERADGVTLTGTVEPGSTVMVTLGSVTRAASVDGAGNWTVTFAATDIPQGTYDSSITVSATDLAGNTNVITDSVRIDTEVLATSSPLQTADDVINAAEQATGVTLTGTAEPGSTVSVELQGVTQPAVVDAAGNWTVSFAPSTLPDGTYTTAATITATDPAGNVSTLTESFDVDTQVDSPNVDSVTFAGTDVWRVGTQDAEGSYSINTLETNGTVGSPSSSMTQHPVLGTEFTFTQAVSDGTNLVVNRTDAAGNNSATLVVLEDGAGNGTTVGHAGLSGFDIQALNLDYGDNTGLTLTEAQIKALSDSSDTLTIHGGNDDTVTVNGAVATGQTQQIDGQTYEVYTIGNDGATLIVEQDVNVII